MIKIAFFACLFACGGNSENATDSGTHTAGLVTSSCQGHENKLCLEYDSQVQDQDSYAKPVLKITGITKTNGSAGLFKDSECSIPASDEILVGSNEASITAHTLGKIKTSLWAQYKDLQNNLSPCFGPVVVDLNANYWHTLKAQTSCTKESDRHRTEDLTFKIVGGKAGYSNGLIQFSGNLQLEGLVGSAVAGLFGHSGFGDLIYVQGIQNEKGKMFYNVTLSLCLYGPDLEVNNFSVSGSVPYPFEGDPFRSKVKGVDLKFFTKTHAGAITRTFSQK